ncbi:MAG TPA: Re/Si-specific NAD(P)(+) transhydrogenase subunit alpha [Candidatus Dormibacteraeota bacterium]|nr:Re/Si-specific NAD(P)(+) transhydrogenase subunit alpha [Candidatus Dormibacteraeota bacterium]
MVIGVPKEIYPGERRVALVPAVLPNLKKAGLEVVIEAGAGAEAGYPDAEYEAKGAKILAGRAQVFSTADVIIQVLCHGANDRTGASDMPLLRPGQALMGFLRPLGSLETVRQVAATGASAFSFELMPRITRAQNMDALSSMATVAGYKAVILAADTLPRMFPMMTTAAGTITPARVFVIGAGVAGLNAIATSHRLGAITSGYDVRPAAREQIQSLGGRIVELELETEQSEDQRGYAKAQDEAFYQKQREQLGNVVAQSDVVITTAVVPGRRPPLLITADAVGRMAPGSVVVDMAAERGGNCELTRAGETLDHHGVRVVGHFNLASSVPYHASQMYARNATTFLLHLVKDGQIPLDRDDEILRDTLLTRGGEIVQPRVREFFKLPALATN